MICGLIEEAVMSGARRSRACHTVGLRRADRGAVAWCSSE